MNKQYLLLFGAGLGSLLFSIYLLKETAGDIGGLFDYVLLIIFLIVIPGGCFYFIAERIKDSRKQRAWEQQDKLINAEEEQREIEKAKNEAERRTEQLDALRADERFRKGAGLFSHLLNTDWINYQQVRVRYEEDAEGNSIISEETYDEVNDSVRRIIATNSGLVSESRSSLVEITYPKASYALFTLVSNGSLYFLELFVDAGVWDMDRERRDSEYCISLFTLNRSHTKEEIRFAYGLHGKALVQLFSLDVARGESSIKGLDGLDDALPNLTLAELQDILPLRELYARIVDEKERWKQAERDAPAGRADPLPQDEKN